MACFGGTHCAFNFFRANFPFLGIDLTDCIFENLEYTFTYYIYICVMYFVKLWINILLADIWGNMVIALLFMILYGPIW